MRGEGGVLTAAASPRHFSCNFFTLATLASMARLIAPTPAALRTSTVAVIPPRPSKEEEGEGEADGEDETSRCWLPPRALKCTSGVTPDAFGAGGADGDETLSAVDVCDCVSVRR